MSWSNQLEPNSLPAEQITQAVAANGLTNQYLATSDSSMFQQSLQAFLSLNPHITPAIISLVTQQQHREESQQLQAQIDHVQYQIVQLKQLQQMQQMEHWQIRLQLQQYLSMSHSGSNITLNTHLMPPIAGIMPAFTGVALSTTDSNPVVSPAEPSVASSSEPQEVSEHY
jgi:TolA-binding protein